MISEHRREVIRYYFSSLPTLLFGLVSVRLPVLPATATFAARTNDIVFSGIDLWKGCIAVVPAEFNNAIVTKEFPIYEVTDKRIDPEFLSCLLRSRYFQRAFRAITTGHSNRRRTQVLDFESLDVCFPPDRAEQSRLITTILLARESQREATESLHSARLTFSDVIDKRGSEELPDLDIEPNVIRATELF